MSHDSMSDGIFSSIVAANSNPAFAHRTVCGVNRTQAKKKERKKVAGRSRDHGGGGEGRELQRSRKIEIDDPRAEPDRPEGKGKEKDQPPPLSFRAPKSEYSLLLGVVKGKNGSEGREKVAEQHKKTSLLFGSERRDIVKREVRVHWGARREGGREGGPGGPFRTRRSYSTTREGEREGRAPGPDKSITCSFSTPVCFVWPSPRLVSTFERGNVFFLLFFCIRIARRGICLFLSPSPPLSAAVTTFISLG